MLYLKFISSQTNNDIYIVLHGYMYLNKV